MSEPATNSLPSRSWRTRFPFKLTALLGAGGLVMLFVFSSNAQLPQRPGGMFGGPSGPGGPEATDVELVKEFDLDRDGMLNTEERKKARASLTTTTRRGPGGRGPGGRGGNRPAGKPGPLVSPEDVKIYDQESLYDPAILRTLFLEFENDDWEQELAAFKPTDVEVPAKLTVDGKSYPEVGVSFRGASSFFSIPEGSKRSLNLSIDFVNEDQRLNGYKTLNLLNCNGDASMMSSYLYAIVTRPRIAAPQVNFVKVVINGRSWGIYANAQQFNKDFLKENYGTKKGTRWKVNGSPRGDAGLRYTGDDIEDYRSRYEIKSKDKQEAWKQLINLCKVLNETPPAQLEEKLEPILDLEGVLWFLAADVALNNSDGYWTRASDYSIYLDPDGRFHILPHDMNESFRASRGGGPGGGPGGPGGPGGIFDRFFGPPGGGPPPGEGGRPGEFQRDRNPNRGTDRQRRQRNSGPDQQGAPGAGGRGGGSYELDPLVGLDNDRFPLRSKLLANENLKTRYLQFIRDIARHSLDWNHIGSDINKAYQLISKEVEADTRKLTTYQAFEQATDPDSPAQPGSLREFCEKRSQYLLNHEAIKDLPNEPVILKSDGKPRAYLGSRGKAPKSSTRGEN